MMHGCAKLGRWGSQLGEGWSFERKRRNAKSPMDKLMPMPQGTTMDCGRWEACGLADNGCSAFWAYETTAEQVKHLNQIVTDKPRKPNLEPTHTKTPLAPLMPPQKPES